MAVNMVLDVYEDVMIFVHTSDPPSDAEWAEYMSTLKRFDPERLRTIGFTDGGAPNSAQRKAVNDALNGKTSLGAIVSRSMLVRSAVTTLSWFNPKIKAFSPDRTDDAFRYVGLASADVPRIWVIVRRLRDKLGVANLQCIAAAPRPKLAMK